MRPRTPTGWIAAMSTLVLAVASAVGLGVAAGWATHWVDEVPGGDTGLVTSPELETGRLAMTCFGAALLVLGLAVLAVLLRRRAAGSCAEGEKSDVS